MPAPRWSVAIPITPGTGNFGGAPGESTGSASFLAQTFQALDAPAQTARFTLNDSAGDDAVHFRLLVTEVSGEAAGDGSFFSNFRPTTVLFDSGELVLPNLAPPTDFLIDLGGLALAEGQFYALVSKRTQRNRAKNLRPVRQTRFGREMTPSRVTKRTHCGTRWI